MTKKEGGKNTIAIIGGGPGGLLTALLLERRCKFPCTITIFEADSRLGGKIATEQFAAAPVRYESGAAELYDYSQLGPDPLRELVNEFALSVHSLEGQTVVMDDAILKSPADLAVQFGSDAYQAFCSFNAYARRSISPAEYYESDWKADNDDPLSRRKFRELLGTIADDNARRYVEVMLHSDLATESYLTSAMYGLQNFLMNEPDYMRLYSIGGGNERLVREIVRRIKAKVLLKHRVTRVEKTSGELYRVSFQTMGEENCAAFDYVVVALPNNWIPSITFGGHLLSEAMHQHHAFYDHPAHYLRVSILFEQPFWRDQIAESYFMLDAFGGCCVYDEGSRNSSCAYGVLGWLIAGNAALTMSNYGDAELIGAVLDSLPRSMREGRRMMIEGRVHRWVGSVNGMPGGFPAREPDSRHVPEPEQHPELFVVGDYLFDSTINGVLDSADVVAEWISEDIEESMRAASQVTEVIVQEKVTATSEPEEPVQGADPL